MPNWAHNHLTVTGPADQLQNFAEHVRGVPYGAQDEQPLSFARIVPEPDGLYDRPATDMSRAGELLRWRLLRDALSEGRVRSDMRAEAEAVVAVQPVSDDELDALEFHTLHWGTKWDANFDGPAVAIGREEARVSLPAGQLPSADTTELQYSFLTAWSPPTPVITAAGKRWPTLTFTLRWAEPGNDAAAEVRVHAEQVTVTDLEVDDVLAPEDQWF